LGTKYLNKIYTVTREIHDPVTKLITVPPDYTELGKLLITAALIGLVLPLLAIIAVKLSPLRSA